MKKLKYIFSTIMLGVAMTSCSVTIPYTATNNPIGDKRGVSKSIMLFGTPGYPVTEKRPTAASVMTLSSGIVLNGNYGVIEAAKNGGIEKVAAVDVKTTNFLLFTKAEIIVIGE